MNPISKLTLFAVTVATFTNGTALAGNEQLRNQLFLQRQACERNKQTTTIAAYGNRRGVGQGSAMQGERSKTHYEMRWNANGQRFGLFVRDSK